MLLAQVPADQPEVSLDMIKNFVTRRRFLSRPLYHFYLNGSLHNITLTSLKDAIQLGKLCDAIEALLAYKMLAREKKG